MDAIILAGGRGTRIQSLYPDIPKPMIPIGGIPFLSILIDYWRSQGIQRFWVSVWHKAESFYHTFYDKDVLIIREKEELGQAGSVKSMLNLLIPNKYLLLNGDTICKLTLKELDPFITPKTHMLTCKTQGIHNGVIIIDTGNSSGNKVEIETGIPFYDIGTPEGLMNTEDYLLGIGNRKEKKNAFIDYWCGWLYRKQAD